MCSWCVLALIIYMYNEISATFVTKQVPKPHPKHFVASLHLVNILFLPLCVGLL